MSENLNENLEKVHPMVTFQQTYTLLNSEKSI